MKKLLVFLLAMTMALSLSSCNLFETFAQSDYTYDAEKVEASMDTLRTSGYKITLRYLTVGNEVGSQPEIQSSGFTIAEDGDLWYCEQLENGVKTVTIMDFSDDTEFVTYTKTDGEEKWTKTVAAYENIGSKETVKSLYQGTYIATFTSYGVIGAGLKDKGAATVAGRACTKYAVSVSLLGASYNNEYYIDNETGLCLKNVMAVGASSEGSATTSYECTAFEVGYRITLPAESEWVTEDEAGSNQGGSEIGESGEIDFSTIMGGNGSTDIAYGKLDEATKQAIIAEGKKDGVDVSFGTDGSMTVVDTATGETIIQNADGTWVIIADDGSVGQFGGDWPENEFTKLLPKPDFAVSGAATNADEFAILFQNVTVEQIRDYVEKVKAKGFTVDAETTDQAVMGMVIYTYEAKNTSGYTVTVTFTGGASGLTLAKP